MSHQYVEVCTRCIAREEHYHPTMVHNIVASSHFGGIDQGIVVTAYADDDTIVMPDVFETCGPGEITTIATLKLDTGKGRSPRLATPPPDGRPGGWDYPTWKDPMTGRDKTK